MPPKRRNTRASKKADKPVGERAEEREEDQTLEEPKPKRSRGKGKSKAKEEEKEVESVVTPTKEIPQEDTKEDDNDVPVDEQEAKKSNESSSSISSKTKAKTKTKARKEPDVIPAKIPIRASPTKRVSLLPSPSKRSSSGILSRIPSPVKRASQEPKEAHLDSQRLDLSINQAFLSKNLPKLTGIIDDLKLSKPEAFYNEYKATAEIRFKTADDLVSTLSIQNNSLQKELKLARDRISELESSESAQGNKSAIDNQEQLFEDELILDMIEQVVGLRIHKAEDNDDALIFDCSQSGKNGFLDYRLTILKEDSSEIIYSPVENDDSEGLKELLPDYFFDDLTFPLETLQQFYHKIYRGLNK